MARTHLRTSIRDPFLRGETTLVQSSGANESLPLVVLPNTQDFGVKTHG